MLYFVQLVYKGFCALNWRLKWVEVVFLNLSEEESSSPEVIVSFEGFLITSSTEIYWTLTYVLLT